MIHTSRTLAGACLTFAATVALAGGGGAKGQALTPPVKIRKATRI